MLSLDPEASCKSIPESGLNTHGKVCSRETKEDEIFNSTKLPSLRHSPQLTLLNLSERTIEQAHPRGLTSLLSEGIHKYWSRRRELLPSLAAFTVESAAVLSFTFAIQSLPETTSVSLKNNAYVPWFISVAAFYGPYLCSRFGILPDKLKWLSHPEPKVMADLPITKSISVGAFIASLEATWFIIFPRAVDILQNSGISYEKAVPLAYFPLAGAFTLALTPFIIDPFFLKVLPRFLESSPRSRAILERIQANRDNK